MNTVEQLHQLGFTTNEARAYISLLACQPATAYEIARNAGMPTSKIYETVARLVSRGILACREDGQEGQRYVAMTPADLMESIRLRTISETEQLLPALEKIPTGNQGNMIWPLADVAAVQGRVLELIQGARQTLLVSLWPEELAWCHTALQLAESRGVRIALVHFGPPGVNIGATYHHPAEQTLHAEKGGRGLTLVTDAAQVVIATFRPDGSVDGAWSRNEGFVTVAEDYIKHDVYITKVTRFLGPEVTARFGEDYRRLRDVFDAEA